MPAAVKWSWSQQHNVKLIGELGCSSRFQEIKGAVTNLKGNRFVVQITPETRFQPRVKKCMGGWDKWF